MKRPFQAGEAEEHRPCPTLEQQLFHGRKNLDVFMMEQVALTEAEFACHSPVSVLTTGPAGASLYS